MKIKSQTWSIVFVLFIALILSVYYLFFRDKASVTRDSNADWPEYNGSAARDHYSALGSINKQNVSRLKPAWVYSSGGADTVRNKTQMQCNPLIIDGVLYGVSAGLQVFALDAASGKELWKTNITDNEGTLSRGVTWYKDSTKSIIFFGAGRWLYAFDAATGKAITGFGDHGRIDLKTGLERPGADNYVTSNTPNTIYRNLIITGARVAESETALLGDIRAYDVHTGKLVWTFRTIPMEGEPGYETWSAAPRENIGGANAWAGMAIDRERGIVYIPTGSAAFDFYGGNRKGDNLFSNCLLALDAATGKRLWHYQIVHHDIWDRDLPAPPNLVTVMHNGKKTDAVAQITKQGYVFVFDRVTGKPLFDIEERPFPQEAMPGEYPSKTQPVPLKPAPFTRQSFTEKDFNPFVADRDSLVKLLRNARSGSPYIPLTGKMTIFFPGTDGGAQWGGAAADPEGILYVPAKELPVYSSLIKDEKSNEGPGADGYSSLCAPCHGKDRKGNHDGSYPSLLGIGEKLSEQSIRQILQNGKGMMPSFSHISPGQMTAVINFITNKKATGVAGKELKKNKTPYQHTGYNRWYDNNGYPVSTPPWGTLTAIDLNTGDRKWQVALGEYKALMEKGIPATGTDNYGGPLVTAGGLVFIAASRDEMFRAFDAKDGKLLWQAPLPAAGYASPSTYAIDGKQYIVIACGGGKLNTKSGDKYVAFALD
jgi:quinoprotein glucose dehydrogenase